MTIKKVRNLSESAKLRSRAEDQLHGAPVSEAEPIRNAEATLSLDHELDVHRIELEMQNTELRQARDELEKALDNYTDLYDFAPVGYLTLDRNGAISAANLSGAGLLGVERSRLIGKRFAEFINNESRKVFTKFIGKVFASQGGKETCEITLATVGLAPLIVHIEATARTSGQECRIALIDISGSRQAEASLQAQEKDHWLLINNLPVGVIVHTPDSRIVLCNPEAMQLLGMTAEQLQSVEISDQGWHFLREDGTRMEIDEYPYNQVVASGQILRNFVLRIAHGREEVDKWFLVNAYPEFDGSERLSQIVVMFTDITKIKCADEQIRRHLEHLTALVEIDRAINFSFDLNLSLKTLLTHAIVQLGVDAADVLLLNPTTRTLEYVAGRGFHSKAIEHASQTLGKGYAGRAALERTIIHVPDLAKERDKYLHKKLLAGENFVSYHGVPLIAKGEVVGVLEVFQRTQHKHNDEWHDFLKALASQAAIAIDNVTLFDNLQRTNSELAQAYDATIEGWSRALEMRDNETEGHTQRVADLTVRLARIFGLSDAALVQVRWGALLHDIGKMAVTDAILLKQEPLTEQEWVVMKKHTVLAYEMLSPIRYLRAALDIPYAHHEKWDGTGYPLGLKGEQIPLVARIFAIVDVWDALRSDRRYRTSWSVKKVRSHLRSLAGTHFDPHVLKLCLNSKILVD